MKMLNRHQQYFTTSEFAKLCNVTKHTLFHYDDIGILKPEHVNESGYRFYTITQFFTFDIITILKEAGTPLKEIKQYIENQSTEHFLTILEEKKLHLANEQIKIGKMQAVLQKTIDLTTQAIQKTCNQPRIEECEEEYLIAVRFPEQGSEKKRLTKIADLYKYCLDHHHYDAFPMGIIISKHTLESGLIELFDKADYFFGKIDTKCDSELLYIKPKGKYAVIDHQGSYNTIPASYEQLIKHIVKNNYVITGNAYEFELLGYLATGSPEKYIIEIAIQIG